MNDDHSPKVSIDLYPMVAQYGGGWERSKHHAHAVIGTSCVVHDACAKFIQALGEVGESVEIIKAIPYLDAGVLSYKVSLTLTPIEGGKKVDASVMMSWCQCEDELSYKPFDIRLREVLSVVLSMRYEPFEKLFARQAERVSRWGTILQSLETQTT